MKYKIQNINRQKALTLVEAILALALGALILSSLTIVFSTGLKSWKRDNEKGELIQHVRVALWRIMDDLKYAEVLDELPKTGSSGNLQFTTRNLLTGWGVIRYEVSDSVLKRIAEGIDSEIAGSPSEGIYVSSFDSTPMKLDGTNLVALTAGDSASSAIAVRVRLTLRNDSGDTFAVYSAAKLRNRTVSEAGGGVGGAGEIGGPGGAGEPPAKGKKK